MKPCSPRAALSLALCLLFLAGTSVHARSGGHGGGGRGGHGKHSGSTARSSVGVTAVHGHGQRVGQGVALGVTAGAAPSVAYGVAPAAGQGVGRVRPGGAIPFHNGYWAQGVRGGYTGWWWVAGPAWYLYPAPTYPYPAAISDTVIIDPGLAYYCGALQAYFPEVNTCPEPWVTVTPGAPPAAH